MRRTAAAAPVRPAPTGGVRRPAVQGDRRCSRGGLPALWGVIRAARMGVASRLTEGAVHVRKMPAGSPPVVAVMFLTCLGDSRRTANRTINLTANQATGVANCRGSGTPSIERSVDGAVGGREGCGTGWSAGPGRPPRRWWCCHRIVWWAPRAGRPGVHPLARRRAGFAQVRAVGRRSAARRRPPVPGWAGRASSGHRGVRRGQVRGGFRGRYAGFGTMKRMFPDAGDRVDPAMPP